MSDAPIVPTSGTARNPHARRTFLGALVAGLLAALVGFLSPQPDPPASTIPMASDMAVLRHFAGGTRPIPEEHADTIMDVSLMALGAVERATGGFHQEAFDLFLRVANRCRLARGREYTLADLAEGGSR